MSSAGPARKPAGVGCPLHLAGDCELGLQLGKREHAFRSLLELGSETTLLLGMYEAVDLLLFNLMGQFRVARSAVWLWSQDGPDRLVLARAHGLPRAAGQIAGAALEAAAPRSGGPEPETLTSGQIRSRLSPPERAAFDGAELELLSPLRVTRETLGWLALGPKLDGTPYSPDDRLILEASLGFAGAAIHNAILHGRVVDANRVLQQSNERLAELVRLKSEFLSNVNHEIRTPLAIVFSTLEYLNDERDPAVDQDLVAGGLESARRLRQLIEDLLTFSDVQADRLPLNVEACDVRAVLEHYCAGRQPGVTAGLRELGAQLPPALPLALVDPVRLQQILDLLVDNAVKFTPRGSHVTVSARSERLSGAHWVRIDVADDGPGIPPDQLAGIFESFRQGDGSSTRLVGGLGMGLAFAHGLAERMGGQLSAVSTEGEGSTFTIHLPAA